MASVFSEIFCHSTNSLLFCVMDLVYANLHNLQTETADGSTLSERPFPPSVPSQLSQWWHSVGPMDEQDTSCAVITPGLCTQQTRKQIGLGSFLPTQHKDTKWGNLQTQTKAKFLFSLLRPLCSLMRDTPFVQCSPGGCSDGLANYTEKRGI